jgi:hypothetical protein
MLIFLYYIFSALRSCLVVTVYVACDDCFLTFFFNKKRILSILSLLLGGGKEMLMCLMVFICQNEKNIRNIT